MSAKDPIKEIIDEFEDKISLYKKDRQEAVDHFKNILKQKKIDEVKENLKLDVVKQYKK